MGWKLNQKLKIVFSLFNPKKGFTGISLGGHTAAICASVCPSAVPCIPAYCWSTSAGVWTRGALSNRINFKKLQVDINSNLDYELFLKEIEPLGLRRWERKPTHNHNPIFCGPKRFLIQRKL